MKIVTYGTDEDETIFGKKYYVFFPRWMRLDYDDVIYAGGGNDTVHAGGGDDEVYGGSGNDEIYGQAGNDHLYGDEGKDTIRGGAGNDTIYGGSDGGHIHGDEGNDHLYGYGQSASGTSNYIFGGAGNDFLVGGLSKDTLDGGSGNDTIRLSAGGDENRGREGNDTFFLHRDDVWSARGEEFRIDGGDGRDTLDLRWMSEDYEVRWLKVRDVEVMYLGSGNDTVSNIGAEWLDLGAGNDTVLADEGPKAVMLGGTGMDTIDYNHSDKGVTIYTDEKYAQNGYGGEAEGDVLISFETYNLTSHDDRIYGDDGGETFNLSSGDDIAFGYGGDDTINGDWGEDFINGGAGNDVLSGGTENDTFWFDIDRAFGHDTIVDYRAGDSIALDANGRYIGRTSIQNVGNDAIITVYGRTDSSITVIGAAGKITEENIDMYGQFTSIDLDLGLI